jgi:twinkle protein
MSDSYARRRDAEAREAIDRSIAQRVVRLVSSRGDATVIDLKPHLQDTPPLEQLVSIGAERFRNDVFDEMQSGDAMTGALTPWPKVNEVFRMRPGEVTAWIGPNNEGKSTALLHVVGNLALAGARCIVASVEMSVKDQIKIIVRQQMVRDFDNRQRYDTLMDGLAETLTFFDHRGLLPSSTALALIRYCAREMNAQHVVIDNLTAVVPPSLRADEQLARFIAAAVLIASENGPHVHLVGHVRKPERGKVLTRYDWRGTGAASDMVDNVVIVQDNPKKKPITDNREPDDADAFDTLMGVDKQRYGPARRRFHFWFNETQRRLSSGRGYALDAFDDPRLF